MILAKMSPPKGLDLWSRGDGDGIVRDVGPSFSGSRIWGVLLEPIFYSLDVVVGFRSQLGGFLNLAGD